MSAEVADDPWSLPDYGARIALAMSILGHGDGSPDGMRRQIREARLALTGAGIEEIMEARG